MKKKEELTVAGETDDVVAELRNEYEDKIALLEKELAGKSEEAKENYDKFLRNMADFDNFRKRMNKEKSDIHRYGSENLIKSMLPALDNFERALSAAKVNRDFDAFIAGIEMIYANLLSTLEKEGLNPIGAEGEPFDPYLHEGVMHVESENAAEGTVLEELQRGYRLHDRVIRHSMVKVAKETQGTTKEENNE